MGHEKLFLHQPQIPSEFYSIITQFCTCSCMSVTALSLCLLGCIRRKVAQRIQATLISIHVEGAEEWLKDVGWDPLQSPSSCPGFLNLQKPAAQENSQSQMVISNPNQQLSNPEVPVRSGGQISTCWTLPFPPSPPSRILVYQ